MTTKTQTEPSIELLAKVLSEIFSEKHGVDVTIEAVPKEKSKNGGAA